MEGNDVKALQSALLRLGYLQQSAVTGYFGSITEAAVKSFQRDKGLYADGIAGKATLGKLGFKF